MRQQWPPCLLIQLFSRPSWNSKLRVTDVIQRWTIAAHTAAFYADCRSHFIIAKALFRDMAHGAGKGIVQRQAAVVKQFTAQPDLGGGDRVVLVEAVSAGLTAGVSAKSINWPVFPVSELMPASGFGNRFADSFVCCRRPDKASRLWPPWLSVRLCAH